MKKFFVFALLLCFGTVGSIFAQDYTDSLRAFPGAEGYGAWVTGGRGGRVIYVTHTGDTNDTSDPLYQGSLRQALSTPGTDPIIIMFKCGGVIDMKISANSKGNFKTSRSNMTIAGQTALGDGIVIKGFGIGFGGKNVIIRHVRFRPGDIYSVPGKEQSCLWYENASDFIIDHCSFSWAVEESMTVYDNQRTTIQNCLVSESLYTSVHSKGARSYGAQWGGKTATYHHNFLAHHMSRMPRQNGARSDANATDNGVCIFDYVNNVHYNWGSDGAFYGGDSRALPENRVDCNIINNYYIPGPSTTATKGNQYFVSPSDPEAPGQTGQWWLAGNVMWDNPDKTNNNMSQGIRSNTGNKFSASGIFSIPTHAAVTTTTAEIARDTVFASVGATLPKRDAIDARIVNEAKDRLAGGNGYTFTGSMSSNTSKNKGILDTYTDTKPAGISSSDWDAWETYYAPVDSTSAPLDTDGDGMPDWWEDENGLDKANPADGSYRAANKYTNLENYLNSDFSPRANTEGKYEQYIRWFQVLPNTLGAGAVTLNAESTSGLEVTSYSSSNPSVATVSGKQLTVVGPGTTIITATQAGNATYAAAPTLSRSMTVKVNQVITWNQTLTGVYGDTLTLTASSDNSTIPLVYSSAYPAIAKVIDGNKLVLLMPSGAINITLSQAGDDNYNAATSVVKSVTIGKRSQTITWNQPLAHTYGDGPIALTATSGANSITYTSSNTSVANISGSGTNAKLNILGTGSVTITAKQATNSYYEAAPDVAKTFTIGKATPTITWAQPLSVTVGDAPLALSASSTNAVHPISYSSSDPSVAKIASGRLVAVSGGEATITATQDSNKNYFAAADVANIVTVNKGSQAITWNQVLPTKQGSLNVGLTASTSSGLAVSYTSDNPAVASISEGKLSLLGVGEATITAFQAGNAAYLAADSVAKKITVEADPTGVDRNDQLPVQVYPNPASDVLNLSFETEGTYEVSLVDMSGTVVYKASVRGSSYAITTSSYAQGMYTLVIENGQKQRTTRKVMIK